MPPRPATVPPPLSGPPPPARLGKYELRGCLGQGAMGVVHEAFDPVIGRIVALKTLRPQAAGADPAAVQALARRFLVEARAAGRLNHPHIVAVHDYGEDAGHPFIVMERVQGRPLSAWLEAGRPQALADVVRWALPLLDALGAAHRAGVVHRDVKPDNVFVGDGGQVKLGDFGVAALDGEAGIVGTPVYAAPEQLRGEPAGAGADLYAVGVLLYQALTGARPFDGPLVDVLRRVAGEAPTAPSSRLPPGAPPLPPALDRLVLRALAKCPTHRFADAGAFARALARVAAPSARAQAAADDGDGRHHRGRREAGLAQVRAEALVRDARAALDSAQYLFADGTLLVDGDAARRRCLALARSLDEAAAMVAAWEVPAAEAGGEPGGEAAAGGALARAVEAARDAAQQQRQMAARLATAAAAARDEATGQLDRLDERLAVLEAYLRRDQQGTGAGPPGPSPAQCAHAAAQCTHAATPDPALPRRLQALAAATSQCALALQRLEGGWRLPPAWRARAAAAGLRIAALQASLRAGVPGVSPLARCRASVPAAGG